MTLGDQQDEEYHRGPYQCTEQGQMTFSEHAILAQMDIVEEHRDPRRSPRGDVDKDRRKRDMGRTFPVQKQQGESESRMH